ncbi:hypothetical protein Tco_0260957 [Tanacetum coccineum]
MVDCLERSDENAEFHQIATAKSKTDNDVKQIHAIFDGKTMVISESSMRSDLHFNDEDGITCLSNDEIFVNLALMGFLQLFLNNQIALAEPFNDIYVTPIHTKKHQKTHKPRRAKRGQDTEIPQSSGPPKKVDDEGLGSGSGPRCQDTTLGGADAQTRFETASKKSHDPPLSEDNTSGSGEDNMEYQVDLTAFVPPTPHDSPLSGGHILGSNEGSPNFNELINLYTKLSNRVLALENSKTAQDLVIQKLKRRVKRLEKALRVRTPWMNLFKIGTSRRKGLDKENVSKQRRKSDKTKPIINVSTAGPSHVSTAEPSNVSAAGPSTSTARDIFEDEMTTIANTLVAIRSARPRKISVMIRNVKEEPRRAIPVPTI